MHHKPVFIIGFALGALFAWGFAHKRTRQAVLEERQRGSLPKEFIDYMNDPDRHENRRAREATTRLETNDVSE